jgi:outer membrane lipoprotein-sorting protein
MRARGAKRTNGRCGGYCRDLVSILGQLFGRSDQEAKTPGDMMVNGWRTAIVVVVALAAAGGVAVAQDTKKGPPANAVGAAPWGSTVSRESGASGIAFDARQAELLKEINAYFNAMINLRGHFVQIGADKVRMRGKFYVKRPGRLRFDYSPPSRQVIISDGQYLAIQDLDLKTDDRLALDSTPFRLLLRKDVDLLRDARILELQEADDLIVLTLQDKSPDAPGRIRLFLTRKPKLELKEWVTTDAQGADTRVELGDLSRPDDLDANLFKIQSVALERLQQ